jgi:hypothetical protein
MKAGWLFPIYGKIKHVPNHHPVLYLLEQTWKSPIVTVFTSVYQKARFLSKSGCDYQQRLATSSGHWVGTSQTTHVDMLISAQLPFFSEGLVMATCSFTSNPQGPSCATGRLLGSADGQLESAKWLLGVHQLGRHLLLPHLAEPWFHHKPQA